MYRSDDEEENTANQAKTKRVAAKLPSYPKWEGKWIAPTRATLDIRKNRDGQFQIRGNAEGSISDGSSPYYDLDEKLKPSGPLMEIVDEDNHSCNIVLLAFNNALIGSQKRGCFGSGVNSSWPSFDAVYVEN